MTKQIDYRFQEEFMLKTFPRLGETKAQRKKTTKKTNIPVFGEAIKGADFTRYLHPQPALIEITFTPSC